jgi:hypothetical protein
VKQCGAILEGAAKHLETLSETREITEKETDDVMKG